MSLSEREVSALQRKAQTAAEGKRFDEALEICARLAALPETRSAGLRQQAAVHELQGMLDSAIADLQEVIAEFPSEPADFHALALLQLETGQTRAAIASLDRCIALGVASEFYYYDRSSHFFRAVANMKLGELDAAKQDCLTLPAGYSTHIPGEGVMTKEEILKGIEARRRSAKR